MIIIIIIIIAVLYSTGKEVSFNGHIIVFSLKSKSTNYTTWLHSVCGALVGGFQLV